MNKFLFSTMSLSVSDGVEEPFDLEYYIIENSSLELNKGQNKAAQSSGTYGIEVVKTQRSQGIKYTEVKTIGEVCSCEEEIYKIAKLVSDYSVTPITLEDVITDLAAHSFRRKTFTSINSEVPSA